MGTVVFDNAERNRYYGLRIGDTVTSKVYQERGICTVVEYGHLDNNRVVVEDANGERFPIVAEWCSIVKKIEDQ